MKRGAFKGWLERGGVKIKGQNTRSHAIQKIEQKLEELGMRFQSLDAAWEADQFESLLERLHQMQKDARDGGKDYRILMPNSKNPHKRLQNSRSWLKQYDRFLSGEPPRPTKDVDRIRQHVLEHYIGPARNNGDKQVEVLVRDVNATLGLNKAWTNICQALAGPRFQKLAQVPPPTRVGPEQSSATIFHFSLDTDASLNTSNNRGHSMPTSPTNLILYGPPGTGKTYSTAEEAVMLCGEPVPDDREELMQTYQRLLAEGRIEFVTFHQSMSYEDFVEGRQPTTGLDENDDSSSSGFRLETVPGIFRRIAKRAETSRGRSADDEAIAVKGRQVFKMSIGDANNPEHAHLFEEAIDGSYALLGYTADIDLSDDKFENRENIIEALKTKSYAEVGARQGPVKMPFIFRNEVHKGDIVIVPKGNSRFRAIGEFTGDYYYHPQDFPHRRAVRWLWVDKEGVGVSVKKIYTRLFTQNTIYHLGRDKLNIPALERYLNSQKVDDPAEPEPFVLIIDEINRANISKVFGELITLLEPDKRLGQLNELKVRLPYSEVDFGVPSNLHILGTMNTADRSIALLDTALRRRFTFREMMPDPSLLSDATEACELDLPGILATINERIEYLYDREHQIGHAYFIDCKSRTEVDTVMRHNVIPLLAEYFFEDWGKIAAVLGDAEPHDQPKNGGFLKRSMLNAPPGLEDGDAIPRFRWEVRSEDEGFDYARLIR